MIKLCKISMEYEETLMGVDHVPQFSFEIESDERNVFQSHYQLQIAKDSSFKDIVYDSGKIESCSSSQITANFALQASTRYFVRACVFTNAGESPWSETAEFVSALLDNSHWKAPFVSAETGNDYKQCSKGTYVRGAFNIKKPIASAFAHTTALGLYNFYINGEKIGNDEMTPGWTSYNHHLLYQTYDVTKSLNLGENVAGAMLGAGWYKGVMGLTKARNNYGDKTAFAMHLAITYDDGTQDLITTNHQWLGTESPIVFSEIYDGETYDASLEIENWAKDMVPQGQWHKVEIVEQNTKVLKAQGASKVGNINKFDAKKLFTTPQGDLVVDFGQNMAGHVQVTATGKKGDIIEIRCFETLDFSGNVYVENLRKAKTTMCYIFSESKTITWKPQFTYMGFRYAHIKQWTDEAPTKNNFVAYAVHSKMQLTGSIETSNPLLNQLHHNVLWGLKSNFLDVPTDCPQRDERLGWTGDAQIFCRTATYLVNPYTFFSKWLVDLAADQTAEGGVAHVVPNIELGKTDDNWLLSQGPDSAAAWADAAVIIPWTLYLMMGDKEILKRQYSSMKAWVDFMKAHSNDYIWNYKLQFGDWVALDAQEGSYFGATPNDLTCTAYYAYSTGLFAKAAKALGKNDVAQEYEALKNKIVAKFQSQFFDENGNMIAQTQTAHIIALHFDLVPEKLKQQTTKSLKKLLEKENGHLVTGFVGTPYFCHALSSNNCVKEAYELLLKDDFPSWLYQVKMGATTIWEHWDGLKPDGTMWSADMNSFNHYAYGAVAEWMYRVMAGIDTSEHGAGFAHSIIYPRIGGDLAFVEGKYKSIHGEIISRWELDVNTVTMSLKVPANTRASLRLENAKQITQSDGIEFESLENDKIALIGSGTYTIVYERA